MLLQSAPFPHRPCRRAPPPLSQITGKRRPHHRRHEHRPPSLSAGECRPSHRRSRPQHRPRHPGPPTSAAHACPWPPPSADPAVERWPCHCRPGPPPSTAAAIPGCRRAPPPPSPSQVVVERRPRPRCLRSPPSSSLAIPGRRRAPASPSPTAERRPRMEEPTHSLGVVAAPAAVQTRTIGSKRRGEEVENKIRK
ncbi:hypothetical protein PVAP13_9NG578814 [Panicum virgatum]|uniref:Uncharacterized protein n=1 Tax=Panicum virgatum TaxID=38727 RepID=A0A8T0MUF4_PANVG|nr:hypothetical protein PVAP13_9NG578814 [Panicum virgatum]